MHCFSECRSYRVAAGLRWLARLSSGCWARIDAGLRRELGAQAALGSGSELGADLDQAGEQSFQLVGAALVGGEGVGALKVHGES